MEASVSNAKVSSVAPIGPTVRSIRLSVAGPRRRFPFMAECLAPRTRLADSVDRQAKRVRLALEIVTRAMRARIWSDDALETPIAPQAIVFDRAERTGSAPRPGLRRRRSHSHTQRSGASRTWDRPDRTRRTPPCRRRDNRPLPTIRSDPRHSDGAGNRSSRRSDADHRNRDRRRDRVRHRRAGCFT